MPHSLHLLLHCSSAQRTAWVTAQSLSSLPHRELSSASGKGRGGISYSTFDLSIAGMHINTAFACQRASHTICLASLKGNHSRRTASETFAAHIAADARAGIAVP